MDPDTASPPKPTKKPKTSAFHQAVAAFERQLILDTLKETPEVTLAEQKLGLQYLPDVLQRLGIKYRIRTRRVIEILPDEP
jgi:hypothetical protein